MSAALESGVRIGRLTLLQEQEPLVSASGRRRRRWLCRCDCGTQTLVLAQNLSHAARRPHGGSRSCGCLARERAVRHGEISANRPSPEYAAWIAAKKRCFNPSNASFRNYGGRGITVCSRWAQSFEAFLRDMGRRPGPGYSLDRIDPNRGYEPGNCRWADIATQSRTGARSVSTVSTDRLAFCPTGQLILGSRATSCEDCSGASSFLCADCHLLTPRN